MIWNGHPTYDVPSHTLVQQDYTFRDHFYSSELERCVSKVFGLATHDDEM